MRATHWKTGLALAVTAGIGYALFTLVFWLFPEASAEAIAALFYGLDFRRLQAGPPLFSLAAFMYSELVLVAAAFGLGTLFGWLHECAHASGESSLPHFD